MTRSKSQKHSKASAAQMQHSSEKHFGRQLSVVRINGETFLIGVQLAYLLQRKTFNMYRCMKKKGIKIRRASPLQVEYLNQSHAVRVGTHSVTLVPYADGLYFLADALLRNVVFPNQDQESARSHLRAPYSTTRPPLHRRKAPAWEVHRAVPSDLRDCPLVCNEQTAALLASHPIKKSGVLQRRLQARAKANEKTLGGEPSSSPSSSTAYRATSRAYSASAATTASDHYATHSSCSSAMSPTLSSPTLPAAYLPRIASGGVHKPKHSGRQLPASSLVTHGPTSLTSVVLSGHARHPTAASMAAAVQPFAVSQQQQYKATHSMAHATTTQSLQSFVGVQPDAIDPDSHRFVSAVSSPSAVRSSPAAAAASEHCPFMLEEFVCANYQRLCASSECADGERSSQHRHHASALRGPSRLI
mmetsp:Transcript_1925/g.6016  ORF Transcript_1925/g.6016 Transcript_1925/m.6016 type:complete len:416 (-) Transcript_1925:56-1303(-)|eukprot:CAMPEP_0174246172 /NCGR_PEP_ID=MMETSP0417-20130205/41938_1 /TAXON_ID=242541 /ORGANISM="Mayorella sp, Strain BSH-02190019" /LENGTH=415 /DNA_ID=CAMNT_0015326023 /DNA_START=317 /DNA_END=1564 /DNA_ORIENTATION=+